MSFGNMPGHTNETFGRELPSVNVSPGDMAFAEMNQQRVNAGLPPIDPNTGAPMGTGTRGTQITPQERLPGMHAGAGNPQGGGTGIEALNNVFGGLDPRG
jgi:hypothetical protein